MTALLLALISLVAASFRLHALTAKNFWFDECVSAGIAKLSWPQFLLALWNQEDNMAFYYFLLHFWMRMGGSVAFIRGFSVLISVATLPLVYILGKRLFDRRTGLVAAWLLAINAYHIYYAQEARSYALVVLLTVLSSLIFVRNLQEPESAKWGAYTAVSVLLIYSHFFGGLVMVAHGVFLWYLKREDVTWQPFRKSAIRSAYLVSPVVVFLAGTGYPILWIKRPRLETIWYFLLAYTGNGGLRLFALYLIPVLLAGFGAWKAWRANGRRLDNWSRAFVLVWLIFPILAVLVVSLALPLFVNRYLIPCLPALVLIAAAGITSIRPKWLGLILCAAISAASFTGIASYYDRDFDTNRDDWLGATSFVFDRAQPHDGVFFFHRNGHVPFEFYRSQREFPQPWPEALQGQGSSEVTGHDFKYRGIDRELAASKPAGDRVWLVLNYDTDFFGNPHHSRDTARAVYGHGRHLIESQDFGVITVLLYARDETGGGTSARPVPQSPMSPQRAALKAPLLHVVKPCEEAFHSCSGGNSCAVCGRPLCHCVSDSICEAR
jgi:mannosyltransferase